MKNHHIFKVLEDSSRPLVMAQLGVQEVCPRCKAPLSHRVVDGWRAGRRIQCTRCRWCGTWRTGTALSKSRLSCSQFLLLSIIVSQSSDNRRIAEFIGVHQDTVRTWREWLESSAAENKGGKTNAL
ncbi:MAG: hypothetical protein AB9919_06775 [Geobacteraceae bacterium]